MALGTGSEEFFVMLLAYIVLLPSCLLLVIRKWLRKNGKNFTVVEAYVLVSGLYCIARIVVVVFLLYLRYGFIPLMEKESKNNPQRFKELTELGNYLIIIWDKVFLIGTLLLYSAVSIVGLKARLLVTGNYAKELRNGMILCGLFNFVAWFGSLAIATIQWADTSDRFMIWVHIAYCYIALHFIISSLISSLTSNQLNDSIAAYKKHGTQSRIASSGTYAILVRTSYKVKLCLLIGVIATCVRAASLIVDSIMYRYIITRSASVQVIWNIVLKYILWLVPELIMIIAYGLGIYEMQYMSQILSFIKQTALKGQSLSTTEQGETQQQENDHFKLETLKDVIGDIDDSQISESQFKHLDELDAEDEANDALEQNKGADGYMKI